MSTYVKVTKKANELLNIFSLPTLTNDTFLMSWMNFNSWIPKPSFKNLGQGESALGSQLLACPPYFSHLSSICIVSGFAYVYMDTFEIFLGAYATNSRARGMDMTIEVRS